MRNTSLTLTLFALVVAAPPGLAQTRLTKILHPQPTDLVDVNGVVVFGGSDSATNHEPWRTDGTPAGTRLIKDVNPTTWSLGYWDYLYGNTSTGVFSGVRVGSDVYFIAAESSKRQGLFRTGGTAASTVRVQDFGVRQRGLPLVGAAAGGRLFLYDLNGLSITHPSGRGLVLLRAGTYPVRLHAYGQSMLFTTGRELWRSDGTKTGTVSLTPIHWPLDGLTFADLGDAVYLLGRPRAGGSTGLYVTRGTAASTRRVVSVSYPPVTVPSVTTGTLLAATPTHLYYANQTAGGVDLMQSDGTASGTRTVKRITSYNKALLHNFVAVGNRVFFVMSVGYSELWVTDGTAAGTTALLRSLGGSRTSDGIRFLHPFGSRHLVFACDPKESEQVWISDGTARGTRLLAHLSGQFPSSQPRSFTSSGGKLYFQAQDYRAPYWRGHGNLYVMTVGATTQRLGRGCAATGLAPLLTATDPVLAAPMELELYRARPRAAGLALVGVQTPGRVTSLGRGCELFFDTVTTVPLGVTTDASGRWSLRFTVPNDPGLIGLRAVAQVGVGKSSMPLGVDLSNAVLMVPGKK